MSDFLATLAAQALGAAPLALPLVPARYAPMPPIGGVSALEGLLDGKDRRATPAAQAETSLARIDLPPPLFRPVEHDSPYRPFSWLPILEIAEPWIELSPAPAASQEPGGAPTSTPGPDMGTAHSTTVLAEAHVPSDRQSAETAASTPIARQPSGSNTPLTAASPPASDRSDHVIAPSETRVGLADPSPAVAANQGAGSHAPAAQVDPSTPDSSEPRMTAPMPPAPHRLIPHVDPFAPESLAPIDRSAQRDMEDPGEIQSAPQPAPVTLDAAVQRTAVTPDRVSPPAPAITMPAAVAHQARGEARPNDAGEMAVQAARATPQPVAPSAQLPVGTPSEALRTPGSTPAAESAAVQHSVGDNRTSQPERATAEQAAGAVRPAPPALGPADGEAVRPLAAANPTTGRAIRMLRANDAGRARSETGPSTQQAALKTAGSTPAAESAAVQHSVVDNRTSQPERATAEQAAGAVRPTAPALRPADSEALRPLAAASPTTGRAIRALRANDVGRDRAETGPSTQQADLRTAGSTPAAESAAVQHSVVAGRASQPERATVEQAAGAVRPAVLVFGPADSEALRPLAVANPTTGRAIRALRANDAGRARSETGPSIQRDRAETGLSVPRARSETGPSAQRARAETGPSAQRARAETGPSVPRARSETALAGAGEMAGQAMVRPVLPASEEQAAMQGRADRNRAASAPAPLPTIRVTIGRIEVRSSTPARQPAPGPAPRPRPALSLDDYLKRPAKVRP